MKRVWAMLLIVLMLMGCSKIEPAPEKTEEKPPVSVEQAVPEPEPEPAPGPEPEPEIEPVPEPAPAPIPQPQPAPPPDWCEKAMDAYVAVTERDQFQVLVREAEGAGMKLTIVQGKNDWNVNSLEAGFSDYDWSVAAEEDWLRQTENGQMSFYVPGEISFSCSRRGDIVKLTTPEETVYLRAVHLGMEDTSSEERLYDLLSIVPEDAYSGEVWSVAVDGDLEPAAAAASLMEQIAAGYLAAPEWVRWKPVDVRAVSAEIYDIYHGMPEEFCFNLRVAVKVEDPMAPDAIYWQAGAGLETPDADGYYEWGRQVHVMKNDEGNWYPADRGTGGCFVNPENRENKPQLEWLVELFCLTEGFTHDQIVPYLLLELPEEELARLPQVLEQLTEAECRTLCRALQQHLADGHAVYTLEDLRRLMGEFHGYLDT